MSVVVDTMRTEDVEAAILAVLKAEAGTLRMMNVEAIAEEYALGPEAVIEDEDDGLPPQSLYDQFEEVAEDMAAKGILAAQDVFGMRAFHLTEAGEETGP